MNKESEVWK